MKIWVIGRHYPMVNNRMRGSFEIEQAKMLARGGHDVTYIAVVFHPYKKIKKWGFTTWEEEGIRVCAYSFPFFPEKMNVDMSGFRAGIQKIALKKVEKTVGLPDIIHVHYPAWVIAPDVVLRYQNRGCSIVCTEHWSRVLENNLTSSQAENLKKYVEKANAIICVGEQLKKAIYDITKTQKQINLLPNTVEPFFQKKDRKRKDFTFIVVGRLVKLKQVNKIVEAFSDVVMKHDKTKLVIVGTGEEENALKKLVKDLNIDNNVFFTGMQNRRKVADFMSDSDCLVCYSEIETFGVTVIEAWACGIPAICTNTAGVSSYWKEGLGYLVNPHNDTELTNRMEEAIKFQPNRDWISDYANETFSEDVVRKRLESIYDQSKL